MIVPSVVGGIHHEPSLHGCHPFTVGQMDPGRVYVHVFDDTTIEIVLRHRDTIGRTSPLGP